MSPAQPPRPITHTDSEVASYLRQSQHAAILARERARDAQREAARPKPEPVKVLPKAPAKVPVVVPSGQPTPRRAVLRSSTPPSAPVIPPGSVVLSPAEVEVIDYLLATHPATRADR